MPLTLLIIDDDEVDQIAMRRALRTLGIEARMTWVKDAQHAFHALRGTHGTPKLERPLIILLDLSLPGLNGSEFLRRLRADQRLKDSVIFVCSASEAEKDVQAAYRYHVAGYFVKRGGEESTLQLVALLDRYWRLVLLPMEQGRGTSRESQSNPPVPQP